MLYDIKLAVEQYAIANWTLTPIQFMGSDFESLDKWISLRFVPIERVSNTCGRKLTLVQMRVLCYESNPTKVFDLVDKANSFFDCLDIGNISIGTGTNDGLGVQPLDNGTYELVTLFDVTIN